MNCDFLRDTRGIYVSENLVLGALEWIGAFFRLGSACSEVCGFGEASRCPLQHLVPSNRTSVLYHIDRIVRLLRFPYPLDDESKPEMADKANQMTRRVRRMLMSTVIQSQ